LSALIFAWGNYLEPLSVPNLSAAEVTKNEVFRPTPAPPIQALNSVDIQAPAAEPDPRNVQAAPSKVARVHQPKPKKTIVGPATLPTTASPTRQRHRFSSAGGEAGRGLSRRQLSTAGKIRTNEGSRLFDRLRALSRITDRRAQTCEGTARNEKSDGLRKSNHTD
jgi:hypothetical protein